VAEDVKVSATGVQVRDRTGGFRAIPTPPGYTPSELRNAVSTAYYLWRRNGMIPDAAAMHAIFPTMPKKVFEGIMLTTEFRNALSYRGVDWTEMSGLSLEQQSVILKLQDVTDRRALSTKLRELGVSMAKYQGWLKQPLFREATNAAAEDVLAEAVAPALTALAGKAANGEDRAIELLLEMTGRFVKGDRSVENARVVTMALVEAIQKHVTDQTVLDAIMADVTLTAGTLKAIDS
jgi:hypothetical protein